MSLLLELRMRRWHCGQWGGPRWTWHNRLSQLYSWDSRDSLSTSRQILYSLSRDRGGASGQRGGRKVGDYQGKHFLYVLCILVGDIITSNGDMNKEREEKLLKDAFAYCGSRKDANWNYCISWKSECCFRNTTKKLSWYMIGSGNAKLNSAFTQWLSRKHAMLWKLCSVICVQKHRISIALAKKYILQIMCILVYAKRVNTRTCRELLVLSGFTSVKAFCPNINHCLRAKQEEAKRKSQF